MVRSGIGAHARAAISVFTLALLTVLATPSASFALSGGAPSAAGNPPPPASPTGAPETVPSAGTVTLSSAKTSPRKSFYYGFRAPSLRFEIESTQAQNDLQVDVLNEAGEPIRSFFRRDVEPGRTVGICWDGATAEKKPAPKGHYSFRVSAQGTSQVARLASTATEGLSLSFDFYVYAFPVLGAHDFGGAGSGFGAGRSGHTHQGQDVMAECGTPLVAARGGRVQFTGNDGAAGIYMVIDGKGTPYDTAYMHLQEPSPFETGDVVRTGQPIGLVGDTGNAQGCHLHFELWAGPGWYEGGSPVDPLPYLKKWDKYS
ncbi:MAG TPA: peptidoglycan DD-metalloendopeptidase family protein [Solirubrobacterales bacterium]